MKQLIFIFTILSLNIKAQKVYSVNSAYKADVKVYVVDAEYKAKKKIYFVDAEYKAELKIYFVNAAYKAAWRKSDKKHLMY